ncbi:NUDIX hydrolase [Dactylosporangium aurantiacum]|uniref:NUDIX hydrolase n=2 Tax=Dactylosporangium aurantiacum TaxID=35754 RepID=A0A9Q9MSE7_9ACTN|nr:NUDIX domain-containing protein [Dactylosporangium aurantiacum]MDG6104402.1 NUDIX domain-containing protein [Dactylosporangium aurantiacum]UWZ59412.1 NUDIX hydrolase [Dactylosporangium aurantiacum]
MSTVVRSAGGVVWRPARDGVEIVLVHRPRYDDWSLPKGKIDPGEHELAAAVREVHEETLVHGVPQARLPSIRYLTGAPGVEKVVDFWSMRALVWQDRPADDEIEEARWVPATQAPALLSYAHDRGVVKAFLELPPVTSVVALVRHARAGKRKEWKGPDGLRPLDRDGERDAEALSGLLRLLRPERVVSATPLRCQQTVEPLGLPFALDATFDEERSPTAAANALRALAAPGGTTVVCSQGKLMPPLLVALTGRTNVDFHTRKGSGWIITFSGDRLLGWEPLRPLTV